MQRERRGQRHPVTGPGDKAANNNADPGSDEQQEPATSAAVISANISRGKPVTVDIDRKVRLRVASGTFEEVQVTGPKGGDRRGPAVADKTQWVVRRPRSRPRPRYRVTSTAVDAEGLKKGYEAGFKTRTLTLDEQTYPSFVPLQGQTVGVGMPVIIRFDVPVTDKAAIEKHLR